MGLCYIYQKYVFNTQIREIVTNGVRLKFSGDYHWSVNYSTLPGKTMGELIVGILGSVCPQEVT